MCQHVESHTLEFGILLRLSGLAARWTFSPTGVQFLVKPRNPVCDIVRLMIPNLVESALMGKIQYQSISTYVLNSLSVLTLATDIKQVMPFSDIC